MKAKKHAHPTGRTRTVELDGKPYTVEFGFRAYANMKDLTGISLLHGWDPAAMDAKEYACLLFSGLLKHHRDIDLEFCFDALSGRNFEEVQTALFEAYKASLPPQKEDANPTQPVTN